MSLEVDFEGAKYDEVRQAVTFRAVDGEIEIRCVITAEALNERAGTNVDGEALLVVLLLYRGEVERVVRRMYEKGGAGIDKEIRLTAEELRR